MEATTLQRPLDTQHARLRFARELAGLDQTELGEILGYERKRISQFEAGAKIKPGLVTAWALACGVPAVWIRNGGELVLRMISPLRGPSDGPNGTSRWKPRFADSYDVAA